MPVEQAQCRRRPAPQRPGRRRREAPPRPADRDQGPGLHEGHPHHLRLADLRGQRARRRRPDRRAHPRSRRDRHWQDEHPRVRRWVADLQPRVRQDPQPLGSQPHLRRFERRRGDGARQRHAADRRRQRPRRFATQPGQLLRRGRLPADSRPGAARASRAGLGRPRRARTDGANRRRRGAPVLGHRRARPERSDLACSARHTLPPGRTSRSPRPPPRLDSQPRPLPGRARGSRGLHGRPARPSPRSAPRSSRPRPTSPAPTASSAPSAPTCSPTSSGTCSPNTTAK